MHYSASRGKIAERNQKQGYGACERTCRKNYLVRMRYISRERDTGYSNSCTRHEMLSRAHEITRVQQLLRRATVPEQSGPKSVGAAVPRSVGELGPHLTQCRLGRGLQWYQVAYPSNRLATIHQRYRQTDRRTDRQTDRRTGRTGQRSYGIGRSVVQTDAQKFFGDLCKTVRAPMLSDRCLSVNPVSGCLSCLSVRIKRRCIVAKRLDGLGCHNWYGDRSRPRPHCVRWRPSSPAQKGHSSQFSAHVCCGKTAGWIKMPLGKEIGLGPGHIVFDREQLSRKGHSSPPTFRAMYMWQNSWINQDAT